MTTDDKQRQPKPTLTKLILAEKAKRNVLVRVCPICGRGHHLCNAPPGFGDSPLEHGKGLRLKTGEPKQWEGLGE